MRFSLLFPLLLLGCSRPVPSPPPVFIPEPEVKSLDGGLKAGVAFLVGRQSPDGAWRSDEYATFKDGTALTPLVLCSLQDANAEPDARDNAAEWLAKKVKADGTLDEGPDGLPYPVYTAALTVVALSHPDCARYTRQRDAWLDYLLARQLIESNGWAKGDPHYGGWGYYPAVPRKPKPGEAVPAQHLLESNVSATRFALEALLVAKRDDRIHQRAEAAGEFLRTCLHPDGGAHFVAGDPVRNKAGADPETKRFHSYGSATADAALSRFAHLRLTAKPDAEPPRESLNWLRDHFDADRHPGTYIPAHEPNRNAVYFYYAAATAKAFTRMPPGELPWAEKLSKALLKRQRADGSWANPLELVRENDPLLATAYAVSALVRCRK
jgi:hypothetical protein